MQFIKCKNASGHDVYVNLHNVEVIHHIPNYVMQIYATGSEEPVLLDIPSTEKLIEYLKTTKGYTDLS